MSFSLSRSLIATTGEIYFEGPANRTDIAKTLGISFDGWISQIDADVPGPPGIPNSGNFANEPSPSTTIFWYSTGNIQLTTRDIVFDRPVRQASVYYAGCLGRCIKDQRGRPLPGVPATFTFTAYDSLGALITTLTPPENWRLGTNPPSDPTGQYNQWDKVTFETPDGENRIKRLRFNGYENHIGLDDLRFERKNHPPIVIGGVAPDADEGDEITFDASFAYDNEDDADSLSYSWSFGGEGTGSGRKPKFTFEDDGTYDIDLTVTDPNGASASERIQAIIGNAAPNVSASGPGSVPVGSPVTIAAAFTDAGTSDAPWEWRVDFGDNTPDASGTAFTAAALPVPQHTYATPGTYDVTVEVTDKDGSTGLATVRVTISNAPPVSSFTAPASVLEGSSVAYDGAASSDPEGGALTYAWSFGDGGTQAASATATAAHTYADDGAFVTTLTVADPFGLQHSSTRTVTVADVAPIIDATLGSGSVESSASVSVHATFTDPGADGPWQWSIDWGDGSAPATYTSTTPGAIPAVEHIYTSIAVFRIAVTVTDADGVVSSVPLDVTVQNEAPVASFTAQTGGVEGSAIAFDASASLDPDGSTLLYAWDFGDGVTLPFSAAVTPAHVYAQDGAYTVSLTVRDVFGGETTHVEIVNIANVAPAVSALFSATALEPGGSVTANISFTDPGTDGPWTWRIVWRPGVEETGTVSAPGAIAPVHATYPASGMYPVTVTITESGGVAGSTSTLITVANAAPSAQIAPLTGGSEGGAISLDASGSTDPEGGALLYRWEFDGEAAAIGPSLAPTASVSFDDDGTYTVRLIVTDAEGAADTTTTTVTIANVAPGVTASVDQTTVLANETVTLAGAFTDPGDDDPWTWTINWGDGTQSTGLVTEPGALPPASHAYLGAGTYQIELNVTEAGANPATGSASTSVTVNAPANVPTAVLSAPANAPEGAAVTLSGAGSSNPAGGALRYSWNFGDGSPSVNLQNSSSIQHTYADDGSYVVTLTVTNAADVTATTSANILVTNVAPTAAFTLSAASVPLGQPVHLSGTIADPGADAPWAYSIDWGNATSTAGTLPTTSTPVTATTVYPAAGNYVVKLRVEDADGAAFVTSTALVVERVIEAVVEVHPEVINLKPFSGAGWVNDGSGGGVVTVRVYWSPTLDPTKIDPGSVTLGNYDGNDTPVSLKRTGSINVTYQGSKVKGRQDATFTFRRADMFENGDLLVSMTELVLFGRLQDGTAFAGADNVRIQN